MKKSYILLIFCILIVLSVLEFVWSRQVESFEISNEIQNIREEVPKLTEEFYEASLFMVGDALYHDGVYKDGLKSDGTYSFSHHLELMKPIVSEYDLAYYNQESILGGTDIGLSSYPRFNSPFEVGDAFLDAGFNLVSTANNHTLDRGEVAILNSFRYWSSKSNVLMSGTYDSYLCMENIPTREVNGIRYAFLSYTTSLNGLRVPSSKWYLVNEYSKERVANDIQKIKEDVDVIIVSMHWGSEYQDYPNQEQKDIAQYLASLGVNIVIGTHPHVIQPIEKIGDTLVIYSLGNFISAQNGIDKLVGLGIGLTIQKHVLGKDVSITIPDIQGMLTYTSYNRRYRDFKVIPFQQMNQSILNHYQSIEQKKKNLVESYGIKVNWIT